MKNLLILLIFILPVLSFSQTTEELMDGKLNEENVASGLVANDDDFIPDEISFLVNNPVDINSDRVYLLVNYQLLSDSEMKLIADHRKRFGNFLAIEELQVAGIKKDLLHKIKPYIKVQKSAEAKERRKSQYFIRLSDPRNKTLNMLARSRLLVRTRQEVNDNLTIGLLGENDPGELLQFSKNQFGFDFISFYVFYQPKKIFKKIIIGDYRIQYGQGLTVWTGNSFMNRNAISGIFRSGLGISPSTSTDENRFLRGAAISVNLSNKITLDGWFSLNKIDGRIENDSSSQFITSFPATGLHRSESELQVRKTVRQQVFGTAIQYNFSKIKAGAIFNYLSYTLPFQPTDRTYNKFTFSGKRNYNAGGYFNYSFSNKVFFAEISRSANAAIAYISGLMISTGYNAGFSILYRNYPVNYQPIFSNPFRTGTQPINEKGVFIGFAFPVTKKMSMNLTYDNYAFPFIKYRVNLPSTGNELALLTEFQPVKKAIFQGRIIRREREQNNSENYLAATGKIINYAYRINGRFPVDDYWEYGFRVELNSVKNDIKTRGSAISQDIFYKIPGNKITLNIRYAIFNCINFDNRIYQFENDLPGTFTIPFYYGKGSRIYLNSNIRISNHVTFSFRYAITYFDNFSDKEFKWQIRLQ